MERYSKQIQLQEVGLTGQLLLQKAKVLIVGIGGLGCPVLIQLAGAGIGSIGIVDGDVVSLSNLHRQFLFSTDDIGKLKVECAKKYINKYNSEIKVEAYSNFLEATNILKIINDYDIVVDCTDNIDIRYLLSDVTLQLNIPLVYGGIHKYEGQVSVLNYKNGPSYRCLFPQKNAIKIVTCNDSGVLGVITNIIGSFQANEVLKIILGLDELLTGKLLVYNSLSNSVLKLNVIKNEKQIEIGLKNFKNLFSEKSIVYLNNIAFKNKINNDSCIILDVRDLNELPIWKCTNLINIPLKELGQKINTLPLNKEIVLVCKTGKRSEIGTKVLLENQFKKVSHLKNGLENYLENK